MRNPSGSAGRCPVGFYYTYAPGCAVLRTRMRNPCKPAVQSTHLDDTNNNTNTNTLGALASPGWIHLVDQLLQLQDPAGAAAAPGAQPGRRPAARARGARSPPALASPGRIHLVDQLLQLQDPAGAAAAPGAQPGRRPAARARGVRSPPMHLARRIKRASMTRARLEVPQSVRAPCAAPATPWAAPWGSWRGIPKARPPAPLLRRPLPASGLRLGAWF